MSQMTLPRILLIILIGIGLFCVLVYITGFCEPSYIKRRIKEGKSNQKKIKARIIVIYLSLLLSIIIISFLGITLIIRSIQ